MRVAKVGVVVLALLAGCGGGSTSGTGGDACPGQVECDNGLCCPDGDTCCGAYCTEAGDVACTLSSNGACDGYECPASEGCGAAVGTCG